MNLTTQNYDWLGDASLPVKHPAGGRKRDGNVGQLGNVHGGVPVRVKHLAVRGEVTASLAGAVFKSPPVSLTGVGGVNRCHSLAESLCLVLQNPRKIAVCPLSQPAVEMLPPALGLEAAKPLKDNDICLGVQRPVDAVVRKIPAHVVMSAGHLLEFPPRRTCALGLQLPLVKGKLPQPPVEVLSGDKQPLGSGDSPADAQVNADTHRTFSRRGRGVARNGKPELAVSQEKCRVVNPLLHGGFGKGVKQEGAFSPLFKRRDRQHPALEAVNPLVQLERESLPFRRGFQLMLISPDRTVAGQHRLFRLNGNLAWQMELSADGLIPLVRLHDVSGRIFL